MPRPRAQYSGSRSLAGLAMPIFTYVAVVSSVLIALMFVVNPMLEKGTRAVVTSDRVGLPKPWHPEFDTNPRRRPGTRTRHDVATRARCRAEGTVRT